MYMPLFELQHYHGGGLIYEIGNKRLYQCKKIEVLLKLALCTLQYAEIHKL